MIKSGWNYSYGLGFWGPNGHDGIWHISLTQSLSKGTWEMPVFAGEPIKNYHIGFDYLLAVIHRLTLIPIDNLYFQILPPLLAMGIGYGVYLLVTGWTNSKSKAFWAVVFTYFSGSFGYVITWFQSRQLDGESLFWSQQAFSTLVNPPYALSLIMVVFGLHFLITGTKYNNNKYLALSTFLFGFLILVKVYAGILILASLFVSGVFNLLSRRGVAVIKVFTGSLLISILIFNFFDKEITGNLVFKPFWFLEIMMSDPGRLNWQKYAQAMINYKLAGNWIKEILAYSTALLIFFLGNVGLRIISFSWFWNKIKNTHKLNYEDILIITCILLGVILPTVYVQKGTAWNTIQFFYYTQALMGILAGVVTGGVLGSSRLSFKKTGLKSTHRNLLLNFTKLTLVLVILIHSLASSVATLRHYLPSRPPAMIPKQEIAALKFLRSQNRGVVLVMSFNRDISSRVQNTPPKPLYLYESTAYVSAYSGMSTYLEDTVNLEITGYNWKDRSKNVEDYFNNPTYFKNTDIKYLYIPNKTLYPLSANLGRQIYNKDEVVIVKL